jgi:hypothetical protein
MFNTFNHLKKQMKRMIIMVAVAAIGAVSASCVKELDAPKDIASGGAQVVLRLNDGATRADGGGAELWERTLTSLNLYVFNKAGGIILRRQLSGEEMEAGSVTFSLPNSVAGAECRFHAVANDGGDFRYNNISILEKRADIVPLDKYNGQMSVVSKQGMRPAGFVMTGESVAEVTGGGMVTTVSVTLRRTVAKIRYKVSGAPDFSKRHDGGKVVITSASISNANASSHLLPRTPYMARTELYAFTQAALCSSGVSQGIFYVFENPATNDDNDKLLLTLSGYFDADGSASDGDRTPVTYRIPIEGSADGHIVRNGLYDLDITIHSLAGNDIALSCTVADWDNPITQSVQIG